MMQSVFKFARISALVGLVSLAMPVVDVHAQGCLSPGQARQAINSGKAAPLSRVSNRVKARSGGEVVGARLCGRGGRLVYIMTVLKSNGKAIRVVADARSGKIVGR